MPIEIRKLTIKAQIVSQAQSRGRSSNSFTSHGQHDQIDFSKFKKDIIESCIEKVEELLERNNRR